MGYRYRVFWTQSLVAVFLSMTAVGTGVTTFLLWHLMRYRRLPASIKASRRTTAWLRGTISMRFEVDQGLCINVVALEEGDNTPGDFVTQAV